MRIVIILERSLSSGKKSDEAEAELWMRGCHASFDEETLQYEERVKKRPCL